MICKLLDRLGMVRLLSWWFPPRPTMRISEEARRRLGGFKELGPDGLPKSEREAHNDSRD
jgi:hypothetical protein